ncbi:Phosphoserine phosphatase RsbU [Bremerella volcania]|uniref:Phosphoserine phosphatase RsbU n=1 Tax=Bremerella volcania TaxID=2527984 RepID=A0A518C814_9BACT|nr:SpoIIE family protein phosphatase [Bremerella volcania]QDU75373.1 Phosphoserine phosphatase RsbU [Bremerella volcania]
MSVTRLPIRVLAPLLFGIPVLIVGVWLSLTWNRQSQKAVTQLAEQSIDEIHRTTAEKIADVLSIPVQVCQVNKHLVLTKALPPDDLAAWRPTFVHESRTFDMLSAISWGSADGRSVWVSRYADGSTYWAIKDDSSSEMMEEWKLNSDGEVLHDTRNSFEFRLETRPWFQTPRDAKRPSWSDPYVWVGGGSGSETTLGISYGIPVYHADRTLLGIVDADYSLNDLSSYLGKLKIGKTGMAFIFSSDGKLLATSDRTEMVSSIGSQLPTTGSDNPKITAVARYLKSHRLNGETRSLIKSDGESYYLQQSPVGHEVGLDWQLLTIVPEQDFVGDIEAEFARSWMTSLVAVLLAVGLGLFAAHWLVQPLTSIGESVRRIGQGDLETRLDVQHAPEYMHLAAEINKMAEGLQDRLRMQKSLSLAMEVQRNLLPSESPQIQGLDIAGHSTYCDETGGDYYDFLDVGGTDEDTAVLVIGDVMGHGVAAALLMATARGILRSRCAVPGSLADFLNHLNDMLVVDTNGERFMTMLLITLSAQKDTIRWASAGHGPPIVYSPQTDTFPVLDGGGLPLGLMEGEKYAEYWQPNIHPGTVILATTDGLEETMNEAGEQFGKQRLEELVRANADKTAEEISQIIRQALVGYRGAGSQDDDLTFVVAKVM